MSISTLTPPTPGPAVKSSPSPTSAGLSPDALAFVCKIVRDRSAIELDATKSYLVEARLSTLARQIGMASTTELVDSIRTNRRPELAQQLVEAMTTNETSFYRDIHPFDALRNTILPELRTVCASKRSINIWSAACSTGQELYSIAMLIKEHCPDLANWKIDLLGTDLSDDVLERARAAKFSQIEVNRGLSAPMLVKYFERDGMHWQLRADLRAMGTFRKLNLIETWTAIPTMDVVFLRNVLIYFAPDVKKAILQKVRKLMAPHAVLFLGAAETTLNLDSTFERVQSGNAVFYRVK
jgi:chemotaxis protein methyltransferase CheR